MPNEFYEKLLPLDLSTDGEGEEGQDFPLIKQADTNHSHEKHCCRWSRCLALSASLSASLTIMGAFLLITAYTIIKPTDLSCARQLSTYCEQTLQIFRIMSIIVKC
jgi:hypothetical protein